MFRPWLIVALLTWLAAALVAAGPAQAQETEAEAWLNEAKPLEVSDQDSPLRKLLKQRYNVSIEETRAVNALYRGGRITLDEVLGATLRLGQAGVEVSETPAERIKYREAVLGVAKTIERIVRQKHESASEPLQTMLRATGVRLDAEIALLREREAAAK